MAVNKKIPMRKCVGCGEMKPKKELLRILRTETGEFVVDALGKANGRGAYLCRRGNDRKRDEIRKSEVCHCRR